MSGVSSSLIFFSYFPCRRLLRLLLTFGLRDRQPRARQAPGFPEHELLIKGLLQDPVFAFLFLLSYYIESPVITELTAGKDLHMA